MLIEAGRRFRAIAEANPVAVLVADTRDGAVRYTNPAAVALLGPTATLPPASTLAALFIAPTEAGLFMEAVARGSVDHYETRLRRTDGTDFPTVLSGRPLDFDGAPCLVIGILDLTERQAAEAQIQRQREMIHQREKLAALGSLLAGVAHELNNPLSVVVGHAMMLQELAPDPGTAARGEKIGAAAERCARIVRTFLAMARQRPPQRTAVDMNQAIGSAIELLGYSLRTAGVEVRPRSRHRPAAGLGRCRPDQPGPDQPRRQRRAGDGRVAGAASPDHRNHVRCRRRDHPAHRHGHRPGHPRRDPLAHLRAVLHHQAGRPRHRRRPLGVSRHRRRAWRHHHGRGRAGRRRRLRRAAAGGQRHRGHGCGNRKGDATWPRASVRSSSTTSRR